MAFAIEIRHHGHAEGGEHSSMEVGAKDKQDARSVASEGSSTCDDAEWVVIALVECGPDLQNTDTSVGAGSAEVEAAALVAESGPIGPHSIALIDQHLAAPSIVPEESHAARQPAATTATAARASGILEAHLAAQSVDGEGSLTVWDKISIVLAAFDEDKDGHLNLVECDALRRAATNKVAGMGVDVYQKLCSEFGADPDVGFGSEELSKMYSRYGALDLDFEVSQTKLHEGSLTVWDKISIVLAAFDADKDGHLNFVECDALRRAATNKVAGMSVDVYKTLCSEFRADSDVGFGLEQLSEMYSRCGTLDRDFEVSQTKLQVLMESQRPAARMRLWRTPSVAKVVAHAHAGWSRLGAGAVTPGAGSSSTFSPPEDWRALVRCMRP